MTDIAYDVMPGGAKLLEGFGGITDRASDFGPAFETVVESFRAIESRRFAENGPGWAPLADSTISMTGSWARQNTNYDQILVDTGTSLDGLMGSGAGSFVRMTPETVEMGVANEYLHWHQTGGFRTHPSGAGWPPQRKVVDLQADDVEGWYAILAGWLFGGVLAEVL